MTKQYLFTKEAKKSWDKNKRYSKKKWPQRTKKYFADILDIVDQISQSPKSFSYRNDLAGDTKLKIYGIREHYIIFKIIKNKLVIVAFEKKERDIASIISKNKKQIIESLKEI